MKRRTSVRGAGIAMKECVTRRRGENRALQRSEFLTRARVLQEIREFARARVAAAQRTQKKVSGELRHRVPARKPARESGRGTKRRITAEQFVAAETGERD